VSTKPSISISDILFSGGNRFTINENEKVILVGPNNSGKSQSLREILGTCKDGKTDRNIVVKDLKLLKKGNKEDLKTFLNDKADYVDGVYRYKDWNLHESCIDGWSRDFLEEGTLLQGFIKNIASNDRLTICEQQKSVSPGEQKSKPQHILYDSESLMHRISELFKRAFGKSLMFDFRGGSKLPIHVGDLPAFEGVIDRVSDEYVKLVRKNPLLDKQGDGMKSYAGILFEAIVSDMDVTLIDEPEAFLHPPQMRKLGETLASEVRGQLLVATHSSDILRGFLEGTQGNVRILRISRENESNIVFEASSDTIKLLWENQISDTLMRWKGFFMNKQ
jgi:predicted ATP-dependent endonuclease of OLD family